MSKKFRSQASSARAASALTGGFGSGSVFQTASSPISYVTEQPDLSQISEPKIVVAFKNLGKRDSTTKAKALEDLQEYHTGEIEQGVLQAWADIYPRTSIDNSRRVRQLAHVLQGNLTVSAGKRMAPYLPSVIGSWLAGTFDNDKSVARSAQDALERSFTTPEKRHTLWKLYSSPLFEYIEDAIIVQTVATLSDERTTNPDDAHSKYVRVVGTGLNVFTRLLKDDAQNDLVATLLRKKQLWEFVYHEDSYLRRTICDLIIVACEKYYNQLEFTTISTCFLAKGLHANQIGSSTQYTSALIVLTKTRPELWTSDYTAKTSIFKRLLQFLRQGSQSGSEDVWSNIAILMRLIPGQILQQGNAYENAKLIAEALRTGVTQPTERINAAAAWATYVQTSLWLSERLTQNRDEFLQQELIPLAKQYITKKDEKQWTITTRAVLVCRGILVGLVKIRAIELFQATWSDLASSVIEVMRLSQPETSKDFKSSQETVIETAKRLFNIKVEILRAIDDSQVQQTFRMADILMLEAATQLLRNRNGKPYGAAGIMELIVTQSSFDKNMNILQDFLRQDLPLLIDSPSAERLASVAMTCGHSTIIDSLYSQRSANTNMALCFVITKARVEDISQESAERIINGDMGNDFDRQIMVAVMQNPALSSLQNAICDRIQRQTTWSSPPEQLQTALTLIEQMLAVSASEGIGISDSYRPTILSNLLVIADSGTELSRQANTILRKLNSSVKSGIGSTWIVQQQLKGNGVPLSIFTLIDLAIEIAQDEDADIGALMPTHSMWHKALSQHLNSPRPLSLSITSPLQGLLYIIDAANGQINHNIVRDQDDFTLLFRLTIYVTRILKSELGARFQNKLSDALYQYYPLALQLVNEKLTIEAANEIWIQSTPEVLQEASDVLSEGNKLLQSWLGQEEFVDYWLKAAHEFQTADSSSYLAGLAWTNIITQYIDQNGPSRLLREYDTELKVIYKSQVPVQSAVLLFVTREYLPSASYGKKILNELVANVTELRPDNIKPLILLNILLSGDSETLDTIPSQRLVFLLQNLIRLMNDQKTQGLRSEVMKTTATLIPQVQDIYGHYWEQILKHVERTWSSDLDLPTMHSSSRLYGQLKLSTKSEDVNEDLQEAWKAAKADLDEGLVDCLQQLSNLRQGVDQPCTITAEMIRRQLQDAEVRNDTELYRLLSSSLGAVQTAAYEVLHRTIPKYQEQLSVEMLLEKQSVKLPSALVELIADVGDDHRRYMLAWQLIFDHFSNASYKLQGAYTAELKETGYVDRLLNFMCESMRIVSGTPIDASKFNIGNFAIDESESAEKEIQWLAIHNYYNTLLRVPSLAKDWLLSQKNRVISPLETWTQKYISPLIVAAALSTVTDWASTQSQNEDDRRLTIKSSPRGSELTATIAIDPESPPISLAISLPGSYPLESPVVTSRSRVGVSEKNWQSWLRTIQIIIFSTGSIIEGLIAFRRNVQGALKGQSECAICYSIIGTDMQTANKKCGTCKNNFHGTCLFRWFKSSNSSSCPLCRNNFNYA